MRKNINKLVAVAIGVSVISGSVIPAFAADTTTQNTSIVKNVQIQANQKQVLTLDDAINSAINNSDKLALKSKEIKLYEDKLNLQDEIDDSGFPYDNLELSVNQTKEQKDFMEDQIAQDITDKYNDLVAENKELNKLKKQIEIKSKENKDTDLKRRLGLKTSIDMKNAEIELETLKNNEKDKENKFKNNQDYFKVITDKDLSQYNLEQDANYEVFKIDSSVDGYFDDIIDKYLKYDKESNDLFRDYVKDSKVEKPDKAPKESDFTADVDVNGVITKTANAKYKEKLASYNGEITKYTTYLESKYNSSAKSVGLEEKKKSYKQILKESYASLMDLENKINVMKSSVEVNNKQLSIAKLKYDSGLITKTEYDNQVVGSEDLDTNLRILINNYNKLKNSIQKPWILSSSSGM